ncbi:hypothetical protein BJP08_08570 [Corynebacterium sp. NML140438]|uniref:hypothetical protein n=1 Tax=Corynebacterium sp. NML140438 TaxID=1906334 RepID=UPI0008FBB500|nr:hypothetical protein [Corynebacterium sp. NML140438]OIR40558.1 hypothetical protein BJP08_08570 [Corynebacterium sp. NML140438]
MTTTPTVRFHGYPKRLVPDIFGGSDWDLPMTDRDSDSIFFLVEYLKIIDPENANEPTAYTLLRELHSEHRAMEVEVFNYLRETPGIQEEKDQAFYRVMFQFLQYQAGQLVIKALEATDGNPYKVVGMMRYHHPSIERAAAVDAVMKTTVEEALKTLGRDHSPQAVEELWLELNQEVDLLAQTRKAQRLAGWAKDIKNLPRSSEAMEKIFLQDQNEAAWTVIDQHLTEPINALIEQQEEEDPWAVDWDS